MLDQQSVSQIGLLKVTNAKKSDMGKRSSGTYRLFLLSSCFIAHITIFLLYMYELKIKSVGVFFIPK